MKDEKKIFLLLVILFSLAAVLSFIWAADSFEAMFKYDVVLALAGFAALYGTVHFTYKALKNFEDPDFDWMRAAALIFAIFSIVVFAGYAATH